MTPPTSVSSKGSTGLEKSYELNAFHLSRNLQTLLRLPQTLFALVNRNKPFTERTLQLRQPSSSLINLDQVMVEPLKETFLGFFREDEGSTPVLQ